MLIYLKNSQNSKKLNQRRIKKDLRKALTLLGLGEAELSVLFVNSRKMRALNAPYRGIDRDTDVLSFSMTDKTPAGCSGPLGDIVVSVPRAISQAAEYGVSFNDELLRLLIHGLLHLAGYDHEINSYRKKKMEKKEKELFDAVTAVV